MKLIDDLKSSNTSLYICCTGGGSGIQDILWREPGTSSYLVGAAFPYSKEEFDSFIGFKLNDKYCSQKAAVELAMAAYIRAREYCILNPGKDNPVGLGLSCATSTNRERKGQNQIHVVTANKHGFMTAVITYPSGVGEYSRHDDGDFVNEVGLAAIATAIGKEKDVKHNYQFEKLSGNVKEFSSNYLSLCMKEIPPSLTREQFFEHPYFDSNGTKSNVFPGSNLLFMPGSFNPLHDGHRDIAWKTGELINQQCVYMVTADSVHKKALTVSEMLDRVAMTRLERYGVYQVGDILFTQNDPLFIDKAQKFPGCGFIIGYDTAARMLDPKWGPEIVPMLHEFRKYKTRFYVCGRIMDGELKTIKDLNYPSYFNDLFIEVPNTGTEHSSTQIREGK